MRRTLFHIWKVLNWLAKRWVVYSDKFGLFSYPRWLRNHRRQRTIPKNLPDLTLGILINGQESDQTELTRTLSSLKEQQGKITPYLLLCGTVLEGNPSVKVFNRSEHKLKNILSMLASEPEIDYLCLVQAGDTFEADWLAQCAASITSRPEADVIYTDQDQIEPDASQSQKPFLKPDFSPALQCSVDLLTNALYRREWLAKENLTANDFFDLTQELGFRAAENPTRVIHVPGILCHTKRPPFPTKTLNQHRLPAVSRHLSRLNLPESEPTLDESGHIRLNWIPKQKWVSIIIPNKDQPAILRQALESISDHTWYPAYEVIVVDNASTDPQTQLLYEQFAAESWFRVVQGPCNFNYSAFNNLGAKQAKGDLLLFLNNDIEIPQPGWLTELAMWVQRPEVGVVGAQLVYPDGRLQHAGVMLGLVGSAGHVWIGEAPRVQTPFGSPQWYRDVLAVTGACLMTRRDVFDAIGGFDETYRLTFSDVTFCLNVIEKGWRVVYNPAACLVHHEGGTRGRQIPIPDLQRMYWELRPRVEKGDPWYNPYLSHLVGTPTLRRRFEESPQKRMDRIQSQLS